MDNTIKECIDYLHDHDLLTECNYESLINALDGYHEASNRLEVCTSKFLIGEKVYAEKQFFDEEDGEFVHDVSKKNRICSFTIESIAYRKDTKKYMYNYLYAEDEIFTSANDLMQFLTKKYYNEYMDKVSTVKNEINSLYGKESVENGRQG